MRINQPVSGTEKTFADDAIIISLTDKKGIIREINPDFVEISGFSEEDSLGKNHNIVRHPDMPPAAFQDLWDTLKQGKPWLGVVNNRCKNGDNYWVEAFAGPIYENGKLTGYQSVRFKPDAEARKRADQLYQKINAGKLSRFAFKGLRFRHKMLLSGLAAAFPAILGMVALQLGMPNLLAWGLAGLSLLLGIILPTLLSKPIQKLNECAREIYDNSINRYVFTGRNDEIGQIRLAFTMKEAQLRAVVGRAARATGHLGRTTEELNQATDSSNRSLQQQRVEIEQVAAAIEEMIATVSEVAGNTTAAANAAQEARGSADEISGVTDNTIKVISDMQHAVQQTATQINELADESQNIGQVLDVIRGIAEQTNLLALNAAIEAARAGEAGRGFAVVSDEVRTLATRTAEATEEIDKMISGLQQQASSAVSAMQHAESSAEDGMKQVTETADLLAKIADAVTVISDMNTQIAAAADQQNTTSQDIGRAISAITGEVESAATAAEQTAASSKQLQVLARKLETVIQQCAL